MPDISHINGVAIANISKLLGRTLATNDNISGVTKPSAGTATTYLDENFDSLSEGYGVAPTNWDNSTGMVVFGTTTATRSWDIEAGTTPSSATGPTADHDTSQGISGDGREGSGKYAYTEATSQFNKRFLFRTPGIDFSNSLANNTLKLYFWFHMYGSNMGKLGVAASVRPNSADDAYEPVSGVGFDDDDNGGLTLTFWDDNSDDGSSTSSGVRISGQQQTAGHGSTSTNAHWRLAVADLNALAGNASTIYFYFYGKTGSQFRSDMAIDDVLIVGEE
jgi:hypothetical protein